MVVPDGTGGVARQPIAVQKSAEGIVPHCGEGRPERKEW